MTRCLPRTRRWGLAALAAALAWGSGVGAAAPPFHGLESTGRPRAVNFTLTAQTGQRVRLSDFGGKLRLLYFGYTNCPGICPTTLADISRALKGLAPRQAAQVQVLMISVDPKRDRPERLARYLSHFGPTFLGLTGTPEEIAAAAAAYGIYYRIEEGPSPDEYLVDHTSMVIVVDRAGFVRLLFPFGTDSDKMTADLRRLLP